MKTMNEKEILAAKLHSCEVRFDDNPPTKISQKIWNYISEQKQKSFLAGIRYSKTVKVL